MMGDGLKIMKCWSGCPPGAWYFIYALASMVFLSEFFFFFFETCCKRIIVISIDGAFA